MTVAFKDFTPNVEKWGLFRNTFESFQDCLQRANQWIAAENPDIINIETVVLPNLKNSEDPVAYNSEDPVTYMAEAGRWHQFVRVWYKA